MTDSLSVSMAVKQSVVNQIDKSGFRKLNDYEKENILKAKNLDEINDVFKFYDKHTRIIDVKEFIRYHKDGDRKPQEKDYEIKVFGIH